MEGEAGWDAVVTGPYARHPCLPSMLSAPAGPRPAWPRGRAACTALPLTLAHSGLAASQDPAGSVGVVVGGLALVSDSSKKASHWPGLPPGRSGTLSGATLLLIAVTTEGHSCAEPQPVSPAWGAGLEGLWVGYLRNHTEEPTHHAGEREDGGFGTANCVCVCFLSLPTM